MIHKATTLFVMTLIVSACGGVKSDTVTLPDGKGGSMKVESSGNDSKSEVTMTGADGKTVTMSSNSKTASFPAFAPQYPGSTITGSTKMSSEGKMSSTATMTSGDKVDAVLEFYKASVTKAGMPIGMTGNFDGTGTLQAGNTKDDKAPSIMVSAAPKDGKTEITLIMANAG